MSILTLGSKKRREGKFPIKKEEKENFQSKKKRRKISNQRESKKRREGKFPIKGKKEARKFPIKEWEKAKRKERKFQVKKKKEWEKVKKEESSWSKKPEEMCREVFGPDNI